MRPKSVLTLMFAGFFLVALAGVAPADWEGTYDSEMYKSEEVTSSPGAESWQYEGAVEAGALPPKGEDLSEATFGGTEGFILNEYGGVIFREEVDVH